MQQILDWDHYRQTAEQAAAEGIVLLKNNNALPLPAGEEIALFGRIQLHYYKSGTGSGGMVNVSHVTNIPEGLAEAGVKLNEKLLAAYKAWDAAHPFDVGSGWGQEPWSQTEMPLDTALVGETAAVCRTAVVVIGRTAGEEQDNSLRAGSFLLADEERNMLHLVRQAFEKVVVLLNVGNTVDMSFVDEYQPDAVAYVWQGGMTGGTGVAAVLTGKVSPSGKLPDTIAYAVSDHPADKHFGDPDRDIYAEDIFVGYRWFETFAQDKVRYPFGFGLSYTAFEVTAGQVQTDGTTLSLSVTVHNIGRYPGKEVVQIYCEAPQGRLGKAARVLCAFRKTRTLAPGEAETMQFTLTPPPSYDDSGVTGQAHCWVLEAGTYRFCVGTDVRSAKAAGELLVPELTVVERCRQALAPVTAFQRMKAEEADGRTVLVYEDVPLLHIDEAERRLETLPPELPQTDKTGTLADVKAGKLTLKDFVAQLPDEALAGIVRGEGMGSPRVTAGTASAFGGVTDTLVAYGIPAGCCSDGPSGMRLDCGTKAFSLPNGTMLAATFNTALAEELFFDVGLEMAANKVDCLLGPGMNIHRHPLNGRNFEYFSEDPFLTGTMAAAELHGLQKAGVTGTVKHCCGNNQETRRHFLDSVISERALREIYLKGFEIAVREGGAASIMTTYGSVNGLWTAGSYDLCTEIIRREWGFTGILMTDWWADLNVRGGAPNQTDLAAMVRAQNDVYMVCADCTEHEDNLLASLSDGTLTRGELQRCACNICGFLLHTHAMERLLGADAPVKVIHRPADAEQEDAPVTFHDLKGELTLPLDGISTDKGTTYAFALKVLRTGWYDVTLTASSEQSELAQLPVTLFSMGTAFGTFTWHGTGGEAVSFTKSIPLFSRFTTMRLYFAQSGLHMESIRFTPTENPPEMRHS